MKVPPFELSIEEQRRELEPLRADMSVAIIRAKNPFNIGAIIRVAHSFLVHEIFLIGTEPYYERACMGMHRYETILECTDEADFLARAEGRPIISVERDHARTTLWQVEFPPKVILLFGSEDAGIPQPLLDASTETIAIPMYGINHSFPVAIAAGMVLCEWARRRDPRGQGHGRQSEPGRTEAQAAPGLGPSLAKP